MWYTWFTLLLVSCALVRAEIEGDAGPVTEGTGRVTEVTGPALDLTGPAEDVTSRIGDEARFFDLAGQNNFEAIQIGDYTGRIREASPIVEAVNPVSPETEVVTETSGPVLTTRTPPRTLDRQGSELAWRSWLQSPESGNPNGPPRRITTKSLFITPLVCPKGQRLDRNGCVQTVTVNKDEHERILLDQLNALFVNSTPSNSADVLYDYGEDEPGPLQLTIPIGLEPQAHQSFDKKGVNVMLNDASIEAELELLKLQQQNARINETTSDSANILSHNVLNNLLTYSDKPKRDSPVPNSTESDIHKTVDKGQKEEVFGHVNIDPILYDTDMQNEQPSFSNEPSKQVSDTYMDKNGRNNKTNTEPTSLTLIQTKDEESAKLNPESDYSDIGEAIKLISRYAEVSTDDNFSKGEKLRSSDDSILGTRTKIQYRRNRPKNTMNFKNISPIQQSSEVNKDAVFTQSLRRRPGVYYRYPNDNIFPPSNYPFKRLQDYWPGRNQIGGVYNNMHENPKRHHHSYLHYFRPRSYPALEYPDIHSRIYPGFQRYPQKIQRNASPVRSQNSDQDIYSLLGLRHWFSSEGASKR